MAKKKKVWGVWEIESREWHRLQFWDSRIGCESENKNLTRGFALTIRPCFLPSPLPEKRRKK